MMGAPMSTLITPLRRPDPETTSCPQLARIRDRVLALTKVEGHTPVLFPNLCVYRFSQATTFCKSPAFGVTLGVALQGTKRVRIAGEELTVDAHRMLVITRDIEHVSSVAHRSSGAYVGLSLSFEPERVARALVALAEAGAPNSRETTPAFVLPWESPIADALERLLHTMENEVDRKLLAPLAMDEILLRLLRSDAAAAVRNAVGSAGDAKRILEAMQHIRAHHAEKLTVDQLARHVAMSPSHFAHRFRAVARISPMRYLREVRLERARALVLGGARVGEAAVEVGFESPAHFTREYKRRFGMPPSKSLALALPSVPSAATD